MANVLKKECDVNLYDLKCNLLDINNEIKIYLSTEKKIIYLKPTIFFHSDNGWQLINPGSKTIDVYPVCHSYFAPNKTSIIFDIEDSFQNNNYDQELISIYNDFKFNLYYAAEKIVKVTIEANDDNRIYLTFEQIINLVECTYLHLYCLLIDYDYFKINDVDQTRYQQSLERFKVLKDKADFFTDKLLTAQEYAEFPIPNGIIEIIQEKRQNSFELVLNILKAA